MHQESLSSFGPISYPNHVAARLAYYENGFCHINFIICYLCLKYRRWHMIADWVTGKFLLMSHSDDHELTKLPTKLHLDFLPSSPLSRRKTCQNSSISVFSPPCKNGKEMVNFAHKDGIFPIHVRKHRSKFTACELPALYFAHKAAEHKPHNSYLSHLRRK